MDFPLHRENSGRSQDFRHKKPRNGLETRRPAPNHVAMLAVAVALFQMRATCGRPSVRRLGSQAAATSQSVAREPIMLYPLLGAG